MSNDDMELGPAMAALTEKRRLFVLALIEHPGISATKAAKLAGYSDHLEAAKVQACRAMHDPKVQDALQEVAGRRLRSHSLLAADVVIKIANDSRVPAADRLRAAGMLLDRTGFGAVQNINVNKTVVHATDKDLERRIRLAGEKLAKLGLNPLQLLGKTEAAVVEGEFTEVKE